MYLVVAVMVLAGLTGTAMAQIEFNQVNIPDPVAVIETNLGIITFEFFNDDAPNHVGNFLKLAVSGFYDGTIFHRLIPGFMIQGGDPNTISGEQDTWGTGGPSENVDAEFNTIKHNRGIISMARSADPNSAGSQFFIVHQNSNSLDGQYTVFGRVITQEGLDTLDKIAAVKTGKNDVPLDPSMVKITKVTIMNRSEIPDILEMTAPERIRSSEAILVGSQDFESAELDVAFTAPDGWLLQQPDKTQLGSPDVVALGAKKGMINPVISLTVQDTNQKTFDELVEEKNAILKTAVSEKLKILAQKRTTVNEYPAYVTDAQGSFTTNGEEFDVQFKDILIYGTDKFYTFAYTNDVSDFDLQFPKFEGVLDSFVILSKNTSKAEPSKDIDATATIADYNGSKNTSKAEPSKEKGGCLIATAAYGTELAPQVQQLRELRDNMLLQTASGTAFMDGFNSIYYSFSPAVADLERKHPAFKEAVKLAITPMILSLSVLNYIDINSEHEMLFYGVGIILMNMGMYLVAPTVILYRLFRQVKV